MLFQYGPAVGLAILLSAIAAAQYGFLPIRPARLAEKLGSRHLNVHRTQLLFRGRTRRDGGRDERQLRLETRPDLLETVLKVGSSCGWTCSQNGEPGSVSWRCLSNAVLQNVRH